MGNVCNGGADSQPEVMPEESAAPRAEGGEGETEMGGKGSTSKESKPATGPSGEEVVKQMQAARKAAQDADYMLNGIEYQIDAQGKQVDECAATLSKGADAAATKALGKAGNEILKQLERLDQLSVPQGEDALRAKRKALVGKGNKYLDTAESHGFKM
eukprot:m.11921 g.11921  ORF g.11921 m.11921 type:complete len:158 (+) comp4488_c0_seq2:26-499(+)